VTAVIDKVALESEPAAIVAESALVACIEGVAVCPGAATPVTITVVPVPAAGAGLDEVVTVVVVAETVVLDAVVPAPAPVLVVLVTVCVGDSVAESSVLVTAGLDATLVGLAAAMTCVPVVVPVDGALGAGLLIGAEDGADRGPFAGELFGAGVVAGAGVAAGAGAAAGADALAEAWSSAGA
jgi:hypothetical protein